MNISDLNGCVTVVRPESTASSGTSTYTSNVLKGLGEIGLQFKLISVRKREISIGGKPRFGIISQMLSAQLKHTNTKVVHSLSPSSIIRGTNILTVHDIIPLIKKDIYMKSRIDRLAFESNSRKVLNVPILLLSSQTVKNQMQEILHIDEERLKVIPHPIDHDSFFFQQGASFQHSNKINVVMVSDFNPRKRVDVVIKALRGVDDIEFYHIGPVNAWDGRFREIKAMSEGYGNIHILGRLPVEKMRQFLSNADVFVFLSEAEGFGLTPIEAMACGTNVIVSDLGIFHETLANMAFFTDNEKFSADTVRMAIKNKLKRNVLMDFSNKYSISKYAESLIELYDSYAEGNT